MEEFTQKICDALKSRKNISILLNTLKTPHMDGMNISNDIISTQCQFNHVVYNQLLHICYKMHTLYHKYACLYNTKYTCNCNYMEIYKTQECWGDPAIGHTGCYIKAMNEIIEYVETERDKVIGRCFDDYVPYMDKIFTTILNIFRKKHN